MNNTLLKLNRLTAWLLFFCMAIYFITGYGMTKGIIDAAWATKMHISFLPIVSLILFVVHSWYSMILALKRWRWWNGVSATILAVFFLSFISFFVYIDRYYQPASTKSAKTAELASVDTSKDDVSNTSVVPSTSSTTNTVETPTASTAKTFNATDLAQYDGQNGQPAYVAISGVVYDLTTVFRGGYHAGFAAGQDQTVAFDSKHSASILNGYPIVGTYTP